MECDSILQNVDILIYIYKLLNIEDQFRLAQVNTELKKIFERYIFPQQNYSTLKIIWNRENVVVTNECNRNRVSLERAELQEFLQYHGQNVKILEQLGNIPGVPILDLTPLQNITELRYRFTKISIKYLNELEKLCSKLELLQLNNCHDENWKRIVVGKNLSAKSLLPMKKLQSLSLGQPSFLGDMDTVNYRDFLELATELKLEYLSLDGCIILTQTDISESTRNALLDAVHLKELNVGLSFYPKSNISPYVHIFKNLVTLVVSIHGQTINDMLLRNIADVCINLNVLHIQDSNFKNIHSFSIPSKVKELSLSECRGLTKNNLRQILTLLGLTKFYSQSCYYGQGNMKNFAISPNLQILHFNDRTYMQSFKLAFGGSRNLKYLSWKVNTTPEDSRYDDVGLQNSTNLEELVLGEGYLSPTTLSTYNLLHKLTINITKLDSNLSDIKAILQHPPLNEVTLEGSGDLSNAKDFPVVGFLTNVRILSIALAVFTMALDFWLNLVDQNEELQLEVHNFNFANRTEFMRTLLTHEKFPKNRKTLEVCGFTVKCSDLRRNFDATMAKLMKGYPSINWECNTPEMYSTIFLKNENAEK